MDLQNTVKLELLCFCLIADLRQTFFCEFSSWLIMSLFVCDCFQFFRKDCRRFSWELLLFAVAIPRTFIMVELCRIFIVSPEYYILHFLKVIHAPQRFLRVAKKQSDGMLALGITYCITNPNDIQRSASFYAPDCIENFYTHAFSRTNTSIPLQINKYILFFVALQFCAYGLWALCGIWLIISLQLAFVWSNFVKSTDAEMKKFMECIHPEALLQATMLIDYCQNSASAFNNVHEQSCFALNPSAAIIYNTMDKKLPWNICQLIEGYHMTFFSVGCLQLENYIFTRYRP